MMLCHVSPIRLYHIEWVRGSGYCDEWPWSRASGRASLGFPRDPCTGPGCRQPMNHGALINAEDELWARPIITIAGELLSLLSSVAPSSSSWPLSGASFSKVMTAGCERSSGPSRNTARYITSSFSGYPSGFYSLLFGRTGSYPIGGSYSHVTINALATGSLKFGNSSANRQSPDCGAKVTACEFEGDE
ncbi:unnamed protein product, partial [Nesidiocoris tenuis]